MTNRQTGFLIGMGAIGLYLFQKARAANGLQISSSQISNIRLNGFQLQFDVTFELVNNSNQNLTINGLGGFLYLNNYQVATVQTSQFTTIARFASTPLVVPVRMTLPNVVSIYKEVQDFIQKGEPLKMDFKGTARAIGLTFPLTSTLLVQNPFKTPATNGNAV